MIFLNTGIGILVYGAPLLLILLTILVSIIEAFYLKKYPISFWIRTKKLVIANLITTIIGIIFIIFLNLTDGLDTVVTFLIDNLKLEKFSGLYLTALSLIVVIPNYLFTVLVEFFILKRILSKQLTLKDVSIANLISYLVLLIIWLIFLKA